MLHDLALRIHSTKASVPQTYESYSLDLLPRTTIYRQSRDRSSLQRIHPHQEAAMSTKPVRMSETSSEAKPKPVDMKFEIVVIPVSNVDRAKEFYSKLGWRPDADYAHDDDFRVLQFTPPGSGCSVIFGKNVTTAAPGSS